MNKTVIDLEIIDELEDSGVDAIALVDKPAIEKNFMYFKKEAFVEPRAGESQSDYMGRCVPYMLDEGKPQDQAVAICISTYENMGKIDLEVNTGGLSPYTNQTGPLKRKSVDLQEDLNIDVFGYPTKYFYICPGAIATFKHLAEMNPDEDTIGMIRAAALQADAIFLIEKEVKEANMATQAQVNSINLLVDDFKDVMEEIDARVGMEHNVDYMDEHVNVVESYLESREELAAIEDLKVGDAVSWKTADQNPRGRIREIVTGSKTVPGTDFELKGTEEDPGYLIEIYEETEGKWGPTGKYVGRKADSILKNVELSKQKFESYNYMFADEDKREIVAIAMVPDMEIPRKDQDGNIYFVRFSKSVIAKIAEKYMREQRLADTNIQHVDENDAGAYVFESWIVETENDKANSVYNLGAPIGSWCVKMRVTNPETWAKVKSGELKGLSIQGDFLDKDEYETYLKDKKMYEDLVNLVKSL
jgi:hypothetical protein